MLVGSSDPKWWVAYFLVEEVAKDMVYALTKVKENYQMVNL